MFHQDLSVFIKICLKHESYYIIINKVICLQLELTFLALMANQSPDGILVQQRDAVVIKELLLVGLVQVLLAAVEVLVIGCLV